MLRIFTVLFAALFISCSEDSSNGLDSNELSLGSFEVKIDGNKWVATQNFVFASISTFDTVSSMLVSAAKIVSAIETDAFGIALSNILTGPGELKGTFLSDGSAAASIVFSKTISNTSVSYSSISGQIVISEITDTNIIGTFNAVCKNLEDENDTITLTDGAFNAIRTDYGNI